MNNKDNKSDEFFRLISEESDNNKNNIITSPFGGDEILFRDENGQIKVLKGNQVVESPELAEEQDLNLVVPPKPIATSVKLVPTAKPLDLNQEVQRIIEKSQLNLTDPLVRKRFENIVLSRLKDIRDQLETREALLSSSMVGGMGFDAQTADRILSLINQEIEQLNGKLHQAVSQEPFAQLRLEAQEILAEPPALVFEESKPSEKKITKPQEIKPPLAARVAVLPPDFRKKVPTAGEKPKIEDIKFKPRLTGPLEELGSLTLTDWRRLADSPEGSAEKILEKIQLLEEESFSKKVEAIKAWKQNQVYRLYLQIGQQSMFEKKPVSEVIAARKTQGQPSLTEEEFAVISDFNQKLRY